MIKAVSEFQAEYIIKMDNPSTHFQPHRSFYRLSRKDESLQFYCFYGEMLSIIEFYRETTQSKNLQFSIHNEPSLLFLLYEVVFEYLRSIYLYYSFNTLLFKLQTQFTSCFTYTSRTLKYSYSACFYYSLSDSNNQQLYVEMKSILQNQKFHVSNVENLQIIYKSLKKKNQDGWSALVQFFVVFLESKVRCWEEASKNVEELKQQFMCIKQGIYISLLKQQLYDISHFFQERQFVFSFKFATQTYTQGVNFSQIASESHSKHVTHFFGSAFSSEDFAHIFYAYI